MRIALVLACTLLGATAAVAQDLSAGGPIDVPDAPRTFVDPDSGQRVTCAPAADGAFICRPAAVADDDVLRRIAALDRRVADLEAEVGALKTERATLGPEDERKLDRVLTLSDKAFRHFFGMVKDLETEFGNDRRP